MEAMPLISVIVPVYKVEKYLDQCVQSIVNQTYRNLEIILVDDGSPDNCGEMCDAWAAKDDRIKVIHKLNGGLSDARNAGMAVASGELLGFVDSDDWISPEMFQKLYEQMETDGSDISSCGIILFWEDGRAEQRLTLPGNKLLYPKEAMKAIIEESWIKQPVCNKLYKAELVSSILFPVGKCNEDAFWTFQAVANASSVSVLEDSYYHYLQRNNSIMGSSYSLKRLDYLDAQRALLAHLKQEHLELLNLGKANMLFSCLYSMEMSMQYLQDAQQKQAYAIIRKAVSEIRPVKPLREYGLKKNIWIILSQISFEGVCRLQLWMEHRKEKI